MENSSYIVIIFKQANLIKTWLNVQLMFQSCTIILIGCRQVSKEPQWLDMKEQKAVNIVCRLYCASSATEKAFRSVSECD